MSLLDLFVRVTSFFRGYSWSNSICVDDSVDWLQPFDEDVERVHLCLLEYFREATDVSPPKQGLPKLPTSQLVQILDFAFLTPSEKEPKA